MNRPEENRTYSLWLAAAWIVVTTPLAWGVYHTVAKSIPLFRTSTAATAPVRPTGMAPAHTDGSHPSDLTG